MLPDTGRTVPDELHHSSHRPLIDVVTTYPAEPARLDAIIVSTARGGGQLATAGLLAGALDCTLVAFCSRRSEARAVVTDLPMLPPSRLVAVDVPADYAHPYTGFSSSSFPEAVRGRRSDLSLKRNLGLLLAAMVGWRRVLFLDDDIRDVRPADLRRATAMLSRYRCVGLPVDHFPDNSVVCHARRAVGARQDTFISGNALVAAVSAATSFFPDVYNEDWLFLSGVVARRAAAATGSVRQLPYDPFVEPARAFSEEFGELVAEGLFRILHRKDPTLEASVDYWRDVLSLRRRLLADISAGVAALPGPADRVRRLAASMSAAAERCEEIDPPALREYVRRWRNDERSWAGRMAGLLTAPALPPARALDALQLAGPR